jgi:hypothetical protein
MTLTQLHQRLNCTFEMMQKCKDFMEHARVRSDYYNDPFWKNCHAEYFFKYQQIYLRLQKYYADIFSRMNEKIINNIKN